MSRIVTYTPVSPDEVVRPIRKKTPLTELVRAAEVGRENTRTAHMTLETIRSNLVNNDSLDEFEAANEEKGIFGWLERRRKRAPAPTRAEPVTILRAASVFATSRR